MSEVLDILLKNLGIKDEDILNIYLFGSRVYECKSNDVDSDWDFIIVVRNETILPEVSETPIDSDEAPCFSVDEAEDLYSDGAPKNTSSILFEYKNIDGHIYKQLAFENALKAFDIASTEAASMSRNKEMAKYIWKQTIKFRIPDNTDRRHNASIRSSFSRKSSIAFVKCGKKMTLEPIEDYKGRKSLWHSIRILLFGIQVAKYNRIINYREANQYYEDIVLNKLPCETETFSIAPIQEGQSEREWTWLQYKKKYNELKTKLNNVLRQVCPMTIYEALGSRDINHDDVINNSAKDMEVAHVKDKEDSSKMNVSKLFEHYVLYRNAVVDQLQVLRDQRDKILLEIADCERWHSEYDKRVTDLRYFVFEPEEED